MILYLCQYVETFYDLIIMDYQIQGLIYWQKKYFAVICASVDLSNL